MRPEDEGEVELEQVGGETGTISNPLTITGGYSDAGSKKEAAETPVTVHEAQELVRQLSRTLLGTGKAVDLEDAVSEDGDSFDLYEWMASASEKRTKHGFNNKKLGVAWSGLTVLGVGGDKVYAKTLADAVAHGALFGYYALRDMLWRRPPKPRTLLENFEGVVKPGEICLVLGQPGSGCSTFLKAIANRREGFLAVDGDVSYGGLDAKAMAKRHRGELLYNAEDDVHAATLTVAQTLGFALKCKTPKKRLPDETKAQYRATFQDLLLKMLGIAHTKNTVVGSAWVRGVSGGERKRVSIAEMMVAQSAVSCFDNSTRGLDSSSALQFVKSLRILADIFGTACFASLYQAGQGIYDQFDKVLLIHEGQMVFFGPAKEARGYMESLGYARQPRQTAGDYLVGCTDALERRIAPEVDERSVPKTPEALAATFRSSPYHEALVAERIEYEQAAAHQQAFAAEFEAAVKDERGSRRQKSPYTIPFLEQVRFLTVRQFQLKSQDKTTLIAGFFTSILIATCLGTLYFDLPTDASGAKTRSGVTFITILFNSLQEFAEIPATFFSRQLTWKHKSYAMYRPGALSVAVALADLPITAARNLIFSTMIYWMAGFVREPGAFFIFYLITFLGVIVLSSFFRLLGSVASALDTTYRTVSVLVTAMVLYSSYFIPVSSMQVFMFWIYYLNPLAYAFSSVLSNEFKRIDILCNGQFVTPHNIGSITSYPSTVGPYQACILPGSEPGQPEVPGSAYLMCAYSYDTGDLWRNVGILIAFFVGFTTLQGLAAEYLKHGAGAASTHVHVKSWRQHLPKALRPAATDKPAPAPSLSAADEKASDTERPAFTWQSVSYTVPIKGGQKQLLREIDGYLKPGQMTALMGASGAGKTTLLDVLAQRKNIGIVSGDICIGGQGISKHLRAQTAYAEQMDVHEGTATIREALRFSAEMRQPASISREEKHRHVEEVLRLLDLEDIADTVIGEGWGPGLGVEARKRVTIGVELASKPQFLLFLDEPTSGLSSQAALSIVRFLRRLCDSGISVLCTIHQPNALLFESFDRLLLLRAGGEVCYFGDIGSDAAVVRSYFSRNGAECPYNANPAEFIIEAVGPHPLGKSDWAEFWRASPEFVATKGEIADLKLRVLTASDDAGKPPGFLYKLRTVVARNVVSLWRRPDYLFTTFCNHITIGLFTGLTFLNLNNSLASLDYRVLAVFEVAVLPGILIQTVQISFMRARSVFAREKSSETYSGLVFALANTLSELPFVVIWAATFYLLFYWPMGFNASPSRAGYQYLMILFIELNSITLGQMIASFSPSLLFSSIINPFLSTLFTLFCGVTIPVTVMPVGWQWLYQLNPYTRLIAGMTATELHGLAVECLPSELAIFDPPPGQTCGEWAGEFARLARGYLVDEAATSACGYCQYSGGDGYLEALGISFADRWRDLGIVLASTTFNVIVSCAACIYINYSRR